MDKSNTKYSSISIPKELIDSIEDLINNNPRLGYKTKAQFITEAIRNHINLTLGILKELEKLSS